MTMATLKFWKLLLHFSLHMAVRNCMQTDPHWFGDKWQNIEGAASDLCGCAVNLKKTLTSVFFIFHCFLQPTHRENPVRIVMLNWEPLLRINYKRLTHYNYSTISHEKAALVKFGKYGQPLPKKKKLHQITSGWCLCKLYSILHQMIFLLLLLSPLLEQLKWTQFKFNYFISLWINNNLNRKEISPLVYV